MKKFLALVLVAVMALGMVGAASADKLSDIQAAGKLVVGTSLDYLPYAFKWTNPETNELEPAGFDMALAQAIADKIGVELEIADQSFGGLLTALSCDEIDMVIGGMSKKPERLEAADFSDAYFQGTQILLVRKEDYDTIKTPADMAGKTIGAQTGALQQTIAEEQFADSPIDLLPQANVLVLDLLAGNCDGVLLVDTVASCYVAAYPDQLIISECPVEYDNSVGVGVAMKKADENNDNASLVALVNEVIAQVTTDGTFDAWYAEAAQKAADGMEASAE